MTYRKRWNSTQSKTKTNAVKMMKRNVDDCSQVLFLFSTG